MSSAATAKRRGGASETHASRGGELPTVTVEDNKVIGIDIYIEIKRIREIFGPNKDKDSRVVPYESLEKFLRKVENAFRMRYVGNTQARTELALGKLEVVVEKLSKIEKQVIAPIQGPRNYADTIKAGLAGMRLERVVYMSKPLQESLKESRQVLFKALSKESAEKIKKLSAEEII